jgi:glycosyltransferase involved in cell wall biosynthesis
MNFFLSPMHRDVIKNLINQEIPSSILPPFLDLENLPDISKVFKDIEYLYIGTISEYKGYSEIVRRFGHVGDDFLFIGPKETNLKLFSQNYLPWVNRKEVYNYMSRAKRFVHLPSWKEPMGRTVLEASLCGCEIIGNSNIGALSFDFDISQKSNYENALEHGVSMLLEYAY